MFYRVVNYQIKHNAYKRCFLGKNTTCDAEAIKAKNNAKTVAAYTSIISIINAVHCLYDGGRSSLFARGVAIVKKRNVRN